MKTKRLLSLLSIAAITVSMLSGCSNSSSSSASGAQSGNDSSASESSNDPNGGDRADINGLVIAEVMSKNKSTFTDGGGNSPDYITIYNGGEATSLSGCYLSDNKDELQMWAFPDTALESGQFYTVACECEENMNSEGYVHTNFSVSSSGEKIYFTKADGTTDELYVPAMPADIAYGLVLSGDGAGSYHYFKSGSPNAENTSEHSADLSDIYEAEIPDIKLNEYMTSNQNKAEDNYGNAADWIELYNAGDEEVDLSGMSLSDSLSKPNKWVFPDGASIAAGEYLVVWCDGLDEFKDGYIHTSFKLSENDDGIVLTARSGLTVFNEAMLIPEKNTSCGLDADGNYVYFAEPTPGAANTSPSSATPTAEFKATDSVFISELAAFDNGDIGCDWIELSNKANVRADLSGWGIGKSPTAPEYTFSDLFIEAGGYILLYADGERLPFKLGLDGEKLYLFDGDGVCRDTIEYESLAPNDSCGKSADGPTVLYGIPTPGAANSSETYSGYTVLPRLSNAGGYADAGENLSIEAADGVTVRYTSDGTEPDDQSEIFGGVTINKDCVLKFRAYSSGRLPSPVYSATYIVSSDHSIPIVCLSCDSDGLFSSDKGIFAFGNNYESEFPYVGANFWQDWEREVSFEYYTPDGIRQLGCQAGIKVFGQYSRAYDQKSVSVHFRGKYGTSSVEYPFFEGNDVTEFSSLVLRAGGQDQKFTRIRDALCTEVFSEYSDIAYMDWQPVAVYINGEYYGFYDLREKINESYFKSHEGIKKENIDILKGNGRIVIAGDSKDYYDMVDYIKNHDMSVSENYSYICSQMDIDNYIDYLIAEIFFCNGDTGNIKFYRDRVNGKWKWILFDLDMALRAEATWATEYNSLKELLDPDGHGSGHSFYTTVQCGLMKNPEFRQKFISRYAELLNTAFKPENMTAVLDRMTAVIDDEMQLHGIRWERPTYNSWLSAVNALKDICEKRHDIAKKQLIDYFGISQSEQNELFV